MGGKSHRQRLPLTGCRQHIEHRVQNFAHTSRSARTAAAPRGRNHSARQAPTQHHSCPRITKATPLGNGTTVLRLPHRSPPIRNQSPMERNQLIQLNNFVDRLLSPLFSLFSKFLPISQFYRPPLFAFLASRADEVRPRNPGAFATPSAGSPYATIRFAIARTFLSRGRRSTAVTIPKRERSASGWPTLRSVLLPVKKTQSPKNS